MNAHIALVALLLLVGRISPCAAEGELLLSDDFSKFDPAWGEANERQKVEGNRLILKLADTQAYKAALYAGKKFGDADIRLKVAQTEGDTDQPGGAIFWGVDDDNYYAALVTADGKFRVGRIMQGKWISPVQTAPRDEVVKGLGKVNELRVVTSGKQATVYVNGKQVTAFRGFPPAGGGTIGVHGESGEHLASWAFSELSVRQGPKPPADSQPPDESLLFADDFETLDPSWEPDPTQSAEGGKLIVKPKVGSQSLCVFQGSWFADADIRVKLTETSGPTDQLAGIIFWAANYNNFYSAVLRADGQLKVSQQVDGEFQTIGPLQEQRSIRKGLGAENELRVVTAGDSFTVYVNGVMCFRLDGQKHPALSKLGVKAESGDEEACIWAFSELRVRKPEAAGGLPEGLLLADDFSKLDPAWGAASESKSVEGNKLIVKLKPQLIDRSLYGGRKFDDADIRLKVAEIEGNTDQLGGISFWAIDHDNRYAALVTADGKFRVVRIMQGKWMFPVPTAPRDEVAKGLGQVNELRVVTSGKQVTVYINDRQVATFRGFPPAGGGQIGVHAESGKDPGRWAFSELSVRQGPKPAADGQPADPTLLFADDFQTLDPSWGTADSSVKVEQGKLTVQPRAKGGVTCLYTGSFFADADITVKVSEISGPGNPFGGLIFWFADPQNYYLALIQADGKIMLAGRVDGKPEIIASDERRSIQKGLGAVNELRVVTVGETATLYVNNVFYIKYDLSRAKHKPPALSGIGLRAESGTEACAWAFSEVRVRQPLVTPDTSGSRQDDLLLTDDFRALQSFWGQPDEYQVIREGRLLMTPQLKGTRKQMYVGKVGDADIRVKVAQTTGSSDQFAGLVFWAADDSNYYVALVNADGHFGVMRRSRNKWLYPLTSQPCDALRTGTDQTNELRVVTSGKSATFYLNDKQVGSIEGSPPADASQVGLYAEAGDVACTYAFSELSVHKGPPPPEEKTPPDDSLLLADDFSTLDPGWGNATEFKRVGDRRLQIAMPSGNTLIQLYRATLFDDADIRLKVTLEKGFATEPAGVIFWAVDSDNFHAAVVQANGNFHIKRYTQGKKEKPVEVARCDAVQRGPGRTNELRVVTKGAVAEIFVNDKKVADYKAEPPKDGSQIGILASSATWAFSDLVVRKPQ